MYLVRRLSQWGTYQLDPDKLLGIYKVTEQKINYGRREIEGGIEKNPQN